MFERAQLQCAGLQHITQHILLQLQGWGGSLLAALSGIGWLLGCGNFIYTLEIVVPFRTRFKQRQIVLSTFQEELEQ